MASWEPVDIYPIDRDEIAEEDDKWDDDLMTDLEKRFEEQRQFNKTLVESGDKNIRNMATILKETTIKLTANQIYDTITKLFNERRKN